MIVGAHSIIYSKNLNFFVAQLKKHGVAFDPVQDQGHGILTKLTLPGGGKLGVYQPRHARPEPMSVAKTE